MNPNDIQQIINAVTDAVDRATAKSVDQINEATAQALTAIQETVQRQSQASAEEVSTAWRSASESSEAHLREVVNGGAVYLNNIATNATQAITQQVPALVAQAMEGPLANVQAAAASSVASMDEHAEAARKAAVDATQAKADAAAERERLDKAAEAAEKAAAMLRLAQQVELDWAREQADLAAEERAKHDEYVAYTDDLARRRRQSEDIHDAKSVAMENGYYRYLPDFMATMDQIEAEAKEQAEATAEAKKKIRSTKPRG